MVVLKGGGSTYNVGNGRQMPWEEVPSTFKEGLKQQREVAECVNLRAEAQACIEELGFWAPDCVKATELFHMCQSVQLTSALPQKKAES
ncbi:hypothetical protein ERJ75_000422100 [Trypanosoma vivax]|uniref:Uncharacterized protein n=1 Tax=Trypanosoma vivax (strain Y486) TaxID=1055687 RepID=G0TV32_TRYVY|nr:hypothetical protein ERJ75_000422100 [Trypanosoma vivax]CCC47797.1 conserved hypothetical protein [Trypanosoma vivax Y486]